MDQGLVDLQANPKSDRPWNIETNGTNVIPDSDRHGKPRELFWIWAGANIGILGVTYGAFLVVFYSLNLVQGIIAAFLGAVLGFLLVGCVGLAGFALVLWLLLPRHSAVLILIAAMIAWTILSVALWELRKSRIFGLRVRALR